MTLPDRTIELVEAVIARNGDKPGPLLPILHGIQDSIGHIPDAAVPLIAQRLNLSRAEVHGVISFYHYFRQSPPGRHVVQICQAESCQSMGSATLTEQAKAALGLDFHASSADGKFTLEPVYCLGNCACSPAVMIDDEIYGKVTPDRLVQLLGQIEEGQP